MPKKAYFSSFFTRLLFLARNSSSWNSSFLVSRRGISKPSGGPFLTKKVQNYCSYLDSLWSPSMVRCWDFWTIWAPSNWKKYQKSQLISIFVEPKNVFASLRWALSRCSNWWDFLWKKKPHPTILLCNAWFNLDKIGHATLICGIALVTNIVCCSIAF